MRPETLTSHRIEHLRYLERDWRLIEAIAPRDRFGRPPDSATEWLEAPGCAALLDLYHSRGMHARHQHLAQPSYATLAF